MAEKSEDWIDKPLTNAPVYFSVIQARFNAVVAMEQYVGKIQDLMRKEGFVSFRPESSQVLEVTPGKKSFVTEVTRWQISNAGLTEGYSLSSDSIIFRTTHYQSRVEFLDRFNLGLKIVHEIVQLDHVSRLGLRYLSAVIPSEGERVRDYLESPLSRLNVGERTSRMSEARFQTKLPGSESQGHLVARIYGTNGPLGYPADMVPSGLVPKPEFNKQSDCDHAVIDIDHYLDKHIKFNLQEIETNIVSLHSTLKKAFVNTVSDHALQVWE